MLRYWYLFFSLHTIRARAGVESDDGKMINSVLASTVYGQRQNKILVQIFYQNQAWRTGYFLNEGWPRRNKLSQSRSAGLILTVIITLLFLNLIPGCTLQDATAESDLSTYSRFFVNWIYVCIRVRMFIRPVDALSLDLRVFGGIWLHALSSSFSPSRPIRIMHVRLAKVWRVHLYSSSPSSPFDPWSPDILFTS